jgi:hypothetical protein
MMQAMVQAVVQTPEFQGTAAEFYRRCEERDRRPPNFRVEELGDDWSWGRNASPRDASHSVHRSRYHLYAAVGPTMICQSV